MPVTADLLQTLARTLRPAAAGSDQIAPGEALRVQLLPLPTDLNVADTITRTLDLIGLTKSVRFEAPGLVPKPLQQHLRMIQRGATGLCDLPVLRQVCDTLRPSGIPGLLGQLSAQMQVPTEVSVALSAEVEWIIKDENNQAVLSTNLFKVRSGAALPEATFHLKPPTTELTTNPNLVPVRRYVHARVKLTALGITSGWIDVPGDGLPIWVARLPIPTVLLMFLHANYASKSGNDPGAVLVVLPSNSPFGAWAEFQTKVNEIRNTISTLSDFAGFGAFLTGVPNLLSAVDEQPYIVPAPLGDRFANLNDIDLIVRSWWENDTEAEDEISSLILIGPPGKRVRLYNARDFNSGEGQLDLTVGDEMYAAVPNLHSADPTASVGQLQRVSPPAGFNPLPPHNITTFGDEISSLQFA